MNTLKIQIKSYYQNNPFDLTDESYTLFIHK